MADLDYSVAIDFDELDAAAADIRRLSSESQVILSDLTAYLKPVIAQWEGATSDEYHASQNAWDTSATDLFKVLDAIADTTEEAAGEYRVTENQNFSRFQM